MLSRKSKVVEPVVSTSTPTRCAHEAYSCNVKITGIFQNLLKYREVYGSTSRTEFDPEANSPFYRRGDKGTVTFVWETGDELSVLFDKGGEVGVHPRQCVRLRKTRIPNETYINIYKNYSGSTYDLSTHPSREQAIKMAHPTAEAVGVRFVRAKDQK